MKVCIEGTTEELINLCELVVYGRASRYPAKDTNKDGRFPAPNETEIPNRFREEGV